MFPVLISSTLVVGSNLGEVVTDPLATFARVRGGKGQAAERKDLATELTVLCVNRGRRGRRKGAKERSST